MTWSNAAAIAAGLAPSDLIKADGEVLYTQNNKSTAVLS